MSNVEIHHYMHSSYMVIKYMCQRLFHKHKEPYLLSAFKTKNMFSLVQQFSAFGNTMCLMLQFEGHEQENATILCSEGNI